MPNLPQMAWLSNGGGNPIGGGVGGLPTATIALQWRSPSLDLRARAPITILDCANVNTSFPEFKDLAKNLGLALDMSKKANGTLR